jgi:two-component system NtrC family sensor kinase
VFSLSRNYYHYPHSLTFREGNGAGRSPSVQGNIIQPVFTIKPTGEGKGLGLGLSQDIIAHGHGGTLTVKSREGQGSIFLISLPVP